MECAESEVFLHVQTSGSVRTDLANRPTEPMLVFYVSQCTKLSCNNGLLQSGLGQATPVCVGVTCGSGRSVIWVGELERPRLCVLALEKEEVLLWI